MRHNGEPPDYSIGRGLLSEGGPRPVYICCIDGQHELPLAAFLVEIDPQDLVLRKGHLVEGIPDPGGLLRGAGGRAVAALREDVPVIDDAFPGALLGFHDEGGVGALIAYPGSVLDGEDNVGDIRAGEYVRAGHLDVIPPSGDVPEGLRSRHHVLKEGSVETPIKSRLRTAFWAALDTLSLLLSSFFCVLIGSDAFSVDGPGPHVIDKGLGVFFKDDDVGVHRPVGFQSGD